MNKVGKKFEKLVKVISKLRKECMWDKKQSHQSLKKYMREELREALKAIDDKDFKELRNELGDMLLHICMHAEMAKENNHFGIEEVIDNITKKMVRRHPHVFGKTKAKSVRQILKNWEKIKRSETCD